MKEFKGFIEGVLCVTLLVGSFIAGAVGTVRLEELVEEANREVADFEAKADEKNEKE